jgi:uracil-DNA glycosylase
MLYDLENKNLQNWVNNFDEKTKNESAEAFNTYYKMKLQNVIYPSSTNIYNAFKKTSYDDVKVVILGQDPYHEEGQANGLAFSVNNGVKMPPSLKNIFKELQDDIGGELRTNPDLTDWAKQGVFLLNSSLTVIEGRPNSMADIWNTFTDSIIKLLNSKEKPIIFVLWGKNARNKKKLIDTNKHFIIESAHPSPLSAYRGFFGSKPFSKVNEYLISTGQVPIDWVGEC